MRAAGTRARQVLSDYDRMRARIPAVQVDASSSTWPRVYVAAPFEEASSVRAIHRVLAHALQYGLPVFWAGRPILSSYRDGVTMFPDVPRLMAYLERAR